MRAVLALLCFLSLSPAYAQQGYVADLPPETLRQMDDSSLRTLASICQQPKDQRPVSVDDQICANVRAEQSRRAELPNK
jgi:hypothetical protein